MFYTNSFTSITSFSDIWKTVKTILPTKTNNTQTELSATDFNIYFSSIGEQITKDSNTDNTTPMPNKTDSIFSFDEIHVSFILKCLFCLKRTSSVDILDMDTKLFLTV